MIGSGTTIITTLWALLKCIHYCYCAVVADIVLTRECLMTLRHSEKHREKIPTVQRHNYCQKGRNNDPLDPYDENLTFCFCNDWDGCNAAEKNRRPTATVIIAFVLAAVVYIFS